MRKIALLIFAVICFNVSLAQSHRYHSVFLYTFTKYVIWPDAYNHGEFEIMVLGESPILEELNTMSESKKVNGDRPIKVTHINDVSQIRKCNILFVPASQSAKLNDIITKVNTQSILIVTEEEGMGAQGSNINFIIKDGKLAFEINQNSVNKQNLKVANELTRMAILI